MPSNKDNQTPYSPYKPNPAAETQRLKDVQEVEKDTNCVNCGNSLRPLCVDGRAGHILKGQPKGKEIDHTISCGTNASAEDGFGYCTCGASAQPKETDELPTDFEQLLIMRLAGLMVGKDYPNIGEILDAVMPDIQEYTRREVMKELEALLDWSAAAVENKARQRIAELKK